MRLRNLHVLLVAFLATALFIGCDSEETTPTTLEQQVAADVGNNVIVCIYHELQHESKDLKAAIDLLVETPSQATLDAARQAWRDTRVPWEMSEAFLYGPVDEKSIDPNVDSWPLDRNQLDSVLNGTFPITAAAVANFEVGIKGFHTIEYLIFGELNAPTQPAEITGRCAQYLQAVAADLVTQLTSLHDSWSPEGENYVKHFEKAGTAESNYATAKDAIEEIIQGLIGISFEVGEEKIAPPLNGGPDPRLEESRFSSNSNADFRDNILGIKAVYTGTCGSTSGKGITHLIEPKNAALDASVRQKIDAAVTAINGMTPNFTDAIFNNKLAVQNAINALDALTHVLEDSVLVVAGQE